MSKKQPILNIEGYRIENVAEYLLVTCNDNTRIWVPVDNVISYNYLDKFIRDIEFRIRELKTANLENFKKEEEQNLRMAIKNSIKKSKSLTGPIKVATEVITPKPGISKGVQHQKFTVIDANKPTDRPGKRIIKDHQKWMDHSVKRNKRYFEAEIPIMKSNIVTEKIEKFKKLKEKSMVIKHGGNHVATFNNITDIHTGLTLPGKTFNIEKTVRNKSLGAYLFSSFQNPLLCNFEVFRATLGESVNELDAMLNIINKHDISLVDGLDVNHVIVLARNKKFLRWLDINSEFIFIKINKKAFVEEFRLFDINLLKTMYSDECQWRINDINFNETIISKMFFDFKDLCLRKFVKYFMFTDENEPISQELDQLLKGEYRLEYTTKLDDFEYFFIHRSYLIFINTISSISFLKQGKTRFFLYGTISKDCIYEILEIFPRGGVITPTFSLLQGAFDVADLINVMTALKTRSDWICRLPLKLYNQYKYHVYEFRDKLLYKEMLKILKWLEECIEDYDCADLKEYLVFMERKYYRTHRMFYIMDNIKSGDDVVTPTECYKCMRR